MTFTDALLGLLVIAIVLVVADAVRRMWLDRGDIRIKIDPRFKDISDDTAQSELPNGGARVVSRQEPEQMVLDDLEPPLVMETEETQAEEAVSETPDTSPEPAAEPIKAAEPVRATEKTTPVAPKKEPASTPTSSAKQHQPADRKRDDNADSKASESFLEVIVVHIFFPQGVGGEPLLQGLLQQGLRYGDMNIFHLHENGELLFSLANGQEPGYFNIDKISEERFRAVSFFIKLPGPDEPLRALDCLLNTAQWLARELDGELRDMDKNVLTPQMTEHLREQVQEFERRMRVQGANGS